MTPSRLIPALILLALSAPGAAAHACYVAEGGRDACADLDPDAGLLRTAASDPLVLGLLVFTLAAPVAAFAAWRLLLRDRLAAPAGRLVETLRSYEDLLPWMLRLSLGIALASAGSVGYLFSPLLDGAFFGGGVPFRSLLFLLGFLFLLGLLVRAAALATALLFLYALTLSHFVLGAAEILGAAMALLLLGGGRPGLDHLLQNTLDPKGRFGALLTRRPGPLGRLAPYTPLALRVCFAATLAYGALVEKLLNPALAGQVARDHGLVALAPWSAEGWALLVGTGEMLLALLFLLGFLTRATSLATFVVLTATLFYFGESLASHVTLFGVVSFLFTTGGGPLSLDRALHRAREGRVSRLRDVRKPLTD